MEANKKLTNRDAEYLLEEIKKKKCKSNILALAEKTGIKEPGDFGKFNHWMFFYSKYKKHLNAYSLQELQELLKQLRALDSNNARSAKTIGTKAWLKKAEKLKNWN